MAHTIQPNPVVGRGDLGTLISFAADGAGTVTSVPQENVGDTPARGVTVGINVSAVGGTPSMTVTLQGIDKASGQTYTLLASAAITAVGFHTLTIFPGATAAANAVANMELPESWQVQCVISGTTPSITGTVGASLLY